MCEFMNKSLPLYKAAVAGDWEAAKKLINHDQDALYKPVTEGGETVLHIAVAAGNINFVNELILNMKNHEIMNKEGWTPLHLAVARGHVEIVRLLIDAEPEICRKDGGKAIHMAASLGHRNIVNFLYSSDFRAWPIKERANILTACTASGLFDVALKMITEDDDLLITKDGIKQTTLDFLVQMSSDFADENGKHFLNSVLSILHERKKLDASNCGGLLFEAAKQGNLEFLVTLLEHFPDLIWTRDDSDLSIFHIAVSNKHVGIFNLIYELDSDMSSLITSITDKDDNNMLHYAAKLAPKKELHKVSNAAFQMQRELLWFKEVEAIVSPSYTKRKNKNGETPQDIFSKEHSKLMERGKTWMTETSTTLMVISSLIATVAFTSAFTLPNSNNKIGIPNTPLKSFMKVFYMFNSIALFLSTTSILACLSVSTSRYEQKDFLHALHIKLMIGIVTLNLSIWAMVVSFCSAVFMMYNHRLSWIHVPLGALLLLCPALGLQQMCYAVCCVYDARNVFGPRNRSFWLQGSKEKAAK